jgi:hypothetical protein
LKDLLLKCRSHFKSKSFKKVSCAGWNKGEMQFEVQCLQDRCSVGVNDKWAGPGSPTRCHMTGGDPHGCEVCFIVVNLPDLVRDLQFS